ncbi:MAG: TonB-dependent receptor, partial [Bacteroidota bacterium]|nr:TonB-dependent receptor [Bacteroidota bacterium]
YGTGKAIVGSFSLIHPQYFIRPVNTYLHMAPENSDDDGDGAYHTQGLYVQEKATLNKWLFLAGLRADFYAAGDEDEGDAAVSHINKLIPSVGVTYAATQKLRLYATYNKGFDPFEPTSVVQVFNEPFKPVNSEMVETGAKMDFFKNKLLTTIALYQIVIDNVAVNANDVSNPNLYVQRGEERSRGIETEIQGYLLPNLSANIFYTYDVAEISKSINPEEIGKIKENAPRHSSSSWFKYSFERGWLKGFGIGVGHIQASARNTLINGFILPGYVVFNSGIQYSKKHFIVAANLNNLANKTYWVSAYNNISKWPGEPRNFMLKLGYHL